MEIQNNLEETIKPLTKCTKDGVAYKRRDDVTEQLTSIIQLSQQQIVEFAEIAEPNDPRFTKEECLVFLLRHFYEKQNNIAVEKIYPILIRRIHKFVKSKFWLLGEFLCDEACDEAVGKLFAIIFDLRSNRADYFQVSFWDGLSKLLVDIWKKYEKESKKIKSFSEVDAVNQGSQDFTDYLKEEDNVFNESTNWLPEERIIILDGLASISEPMRTAFILKNYFKWLIESSKEGVPTISNYFGKNEKTIRNWLAQAEVQLKNWRGEHNEQR